MGGGLYMLWMLAHLFLFLYILLLPKSCVINMIISPCFFCGGGSLRYLWYKLSVYIDMNIVPVTPSPLRIHNRPTVYI